LTEEELKEPDMQSQSDAVRRLLDEQGVRDACVRYWAGVDQRDAGLFASAFTADAEISSPGGERAMKVADMIAGGRLSVGYAHTCHSLANQTVTVTGDTATASSFVVAHLIPGAGPVLVRGFRYEDQLVRDDSGWRIARREYQTLWGYEAESAVPRQLGTRNGSG
jgi:hypothetical protein